MKKQFLTALLLTTSIATFTEISASSTAERLAALRAKAQTRQNIVSEQTKAIEESARSIERDRATIKNDTDTLADNLDTIGSGTDRLGNIVEEGKVAITDHAAALANIKDETERMAAAAKAIADTLDETIRTKTAELQAGIRAGAADIRAKQEELRELTAIHTIITGQVRDLTDAVDTINNLLNPAPTAEDEE